MNEEIKKQPRIALVCDWLTNWGGAERCFQLFHEIWPDAPMYTLIYNEKKMPEFRNTKLTTSALQKNPIAKKKWQFFFNQMQYQMEQFDFSDYDIVFSASHSIAKGIITKPSTLHICYTYSPTRYLWDYTYLYLREMRVFRIGFIDRILKWYIKHQFHKIRTWDYLAGQRADKIIAESAYIANRIRKYYRRESDVIIFPPVNSKVYLPVKDPSEIEDYFLIVGRQVEYKRSDIVIEAFNKMPDKKLIIIGEGPALKRLRKIAKSKNIKILGRVSDIEAQRYFARCCAMIHPQEEDFGITPLEAQSAGRPVIAYRAGGAMETVIENETGIFFDEQNPEAIIEAVKNFDYKIFNPHKIREHALKFDTEIFKENIKKYVEEKYKEHLERN